MRKSLLTEAHRVGHLSDVRTHFGSLSRWRGVRPHHLRVTLNNWLGFGIKATDHLVLRANNPNGSKALCIHPVAMLLVKSLDNGM